MRLQTELDAAEPERDFQQLGHVSAEIERTSGLQVVEDHHCRAEQFWIHLVKVLACFSE